MHKNQALATFLASIPGLGHFYLGLYKRGFAIICLFLFSFLIQGFVVYPLMIQPIEIIFSKDSFIAQLLSALVYAPLWFYGWQIRDAYLKADQFNLPDSRKVWLTRKLNKR